MNKREAKAVEMARDLYGEIIQNRELSDAGYLKMRITKELLKAMQWQAEQCDKVVNDSPIDRSLISASVHLVYRSCSPEKNDILNAGTEEA